MPRLITPRSLIDQLHATAAADQSVWLRSCLRLPGRGPGTRVTPA